MVSKPKQTPFYQDPNIWTLLGVLLIQTTTAGIIWSVNPLYILINMTDVVFPFAAYEQWVSLPGVIAIAAILFFVFAVIVKGFGARGKTITRWSVLALALGSGLLVIGQAWQF